MKKFILAVISLMLVPAAMVSAQTEMADTMRGNGKIYVVVAVLATIFAGIFVYLILLDRKISKIEKDRS